MENINIKRIGIFCGSSMGSTKFYKNRVQHLGKAMSARKIELVYGAGNIGLMRVIADEMLKYHCPVLGVIPHFLAKKELSYKHITKTFLVDNMMQRKQKIIELSDAFITMPGGFGTLDEMSEVLTFNQLELINKPLALYNINNYFDNLVKFLDTMVLEGFLRSEHRNNIIVEDDPEILLDKLSQLHPKQVPHSWIHELILKTNEWMTNDKHDNKSQI